MLIKVTQDHIDKGQPRKPLYCPVALAVMEATGTDEPCCVTDWSIAWGYGLPPVKTPASVQRFIKAFDAGDDVVPFSFQLKVP